MSSYRLKKGKVKSVVCLIFGFLLVFGLIGFSAPKTNAVETTVNFEFTLTEDAKARGIEIAGFYFDPERGEDVKLNPKAQNVQFIGVISPDHDNNDEPFISRLEPRYSNDQQVPSELISGYCESEDKCTVSVGLDLNGNESDLGVRFMRGGNAGFEILDDNYEPHSGTADNLTASTRFYIDVRDFGYEFSGEAFLVWACGENDTETCWYYFDDLEPTMGNLDQSSYDYQYYRASEIVDERTGESFDIFGSGDVDFKRGFLTPDAFREMLARIYNGEGMSLDQLMDVADFSEPIFENIQAEGIKINDLTWSGEGTYRSHGDNQFKVFIYSDDYRAVEVKDFDELEFIPYQFGTAPVGVSGTSVYNPVFMEMPLQDNKIKISSLSVNGEPLNGFSISRIRALGVPEGAVTITENGGVFEITWHSNFFDNVMFKIDDAEGNDYYLIIERTTFGEIMIEHANPYNNNFTGIRAEFFFDEQTSYSDYEILATIIYSDGREEILKMENLGWVDNNRGGNLKFVKEYDGNGDGEGDMSGKNLKRANYGIAFSDRDFQNSIDKIYFNVKYTGSSNTNYRGTFAGSGRGYSYTVYHNEGRF